MRVLYDVANLGYGHGESKHKTGIFRVVEAFAEQLAASAECDLRFCASIHGSNTHSYLQAEPKFRAVPFSHARYKHVLRSSLNSSYTAIKHRPGILQLPLRVTRKVLHLLDNTVGSGAKPLEASSLAWADVYHSSYQAFPPQAKKARSLARFLTVYDLIPILYPQYFKKESSTFASSLTQVIQSVGAEDVALCISQATKDDFCSYTGHNPALAPVVYLAADRNLFYPCEDQDSVTQVKKKYNVPLGSYLLGLSTLAPHKNIEHVIKSFVRLVAQEDVGDLCLVLAGSKGWDYNSIFDELDAAQDVKNRIIITGRVDDEDLATLYSGAMAFTYMSYYEGFGLPPLEAMQCGVPVITSNTSSLPEVVGNAGIMLAPTDSDGWCQSVLQLYQDKDLRQTMRQKSLERAKQFSWERCVQETLAAYKTVLAERA